MKTSYENGDRDNAPDLIGTAAERDALVTSGDILKYPAFTSFTVVDGSGNIVSVHLSDGENWNK